MLITEIQDTNYNTETEKVRRIALMIKRDCQPFLQRINNNLTMWYLWRGIRGVESKEWNIQQCPINREPRDSDIRSHKAADDYFFKKTGIRFRSNAFFVTGSISTAHYYGTEYLFFPKGEFNYCWSSEYSDLFSDMVSGIHIPSELSNSELRSDVFDSLDTANYQFNKGFIPAISSGNEIMIQCKTALILNKKYEFYLPDITKFIKE